MIAIRQEIREIETGAMPRENNLLKNAPHTLEVIASDAWNKPYPRERAAFPAPWTRRSKFWPSVGRVNSVLGDRHLVCSCLPPEAYEQNAAASG
jgi:glycine dehydrogenase